jgi:hypothetical protein
MEPTIEDVCTLAAEQVGVPYVWGGIGLKGSASPGLDCSGLPFECSYVYGQLIPRTTSAQFAGLPAVDEADLRQGDLVLYDVPGDAPPQPAHVAIWWNGNTVLEAPRTGEDVKFSPPLPYTIMGYRRLPFPSAAAPTPTPPEPEYKEETMIAIELANGKVAIYAEGAGTRAGQLLEFTRTPGDNTGGSNSVIDVTDQIGTAVPYTISG